MPPVCNINKLHMGHINNISSTPKTIVEHIPIISTIFLELPHRGTDFLFYETM